MTAAPAMERSEGTDALAPLASALFAELRRLGGDGVGITRDSYGPGEDAAIAHVAEVARAEGIEVGFDAARNLVLSLPGEAPGPYVLCGSHLDSVPQGGNYDGAAGVVAGLLCLVAMRRAGVRPPRPVRVIGLRGEESAWFGKAYMGSSALFGLLTPDDLAAAHRRSGRSLGECMRDCGAAVDRIAAGERLLDPAEVAAYLELHIEQGPVMVARDLRTAVVTGIRGNIRHKRIVCRGEAGHSGAVPRWLRRDAVFAVAELLSRLDEHWRALLERGLDLVVTCGIIATNPDEHAISRIPGEVGFSFEVRSQSRDTLEAFYHLMRTECAGIAAQRKVEFAFDRRVDSPPARMDEAWVRRLVDLSGRLGLPTETVPSGAGHDAAVFANAGIPSAMVFVRNDNGSHNPREAMEMADFMAATGLLYRALLEPA
ncbi:Zn-dependent hydrolase [Arenibaculum sp.]|uniref:Zn-dependent hydrolase n=1 Tax=Arenibaculum sp. TaxID=2865862 RepID=UPI002E1576E8|nr:Zn-dependent hydrolase [Arenibaculum sp.]